MNTRRELKKAAWRLCVGATLATTVVSISGCRVSEDDVHRWEVTERGPTKLIAVIEHDKYPMALRQEATLSLIKMGPRGGVRHGVGLLTGEYTDDDGMARQGALVLLSKDKREQIIDGIADELIKQMQAPPPVKKDGEPIPADPSVPFKDATFAFLSHEPTLVTNDATKTKLISALVQWSQTDFEDRIDNPGQQFGVEQTMRYLGATSVKGLPSLINENTYRLDRIAGLIADIGDADTKQRGSQALVDLAKRLESQAWIDATTKMVDQHNKDAKQTANAQQLQKQVSQMQDSKLSQDVYPAMKRVGGRPATDYLLDYAGNAQSNKDRRKLALAALEGHIDKTNALDVDRLFNLAKSDDVPDEVRELAFQRLGELPKEMIVPRLWSIFDDKKWKARWDAGSLVLKTILPHELSDFMNHLPKNAQTKMGMSEFPTYGSLIVKMDNGNLPAGEPKPKDAVLPFLASKDLGSKLTALGFFYDGKKADIATVQALANDPSPVPKCDPTDECGWACDVAPPGKTDKVTTPVVTVGDFVKMCVVLR